MVGEWKYVRSMADTKDSYHGKYAETLGQKSMEMKKNKRMFDNDINNEKKLEERKKKRQIKTSWWNEAKCIHLE